MFRKLYYSFGPITRRFIRRLYYSPYDFLCLVFGKRNKLVPPKGKTNVGRGDFEAVGDKFFKDIVETCKVSPQMHILDVGCGIGRLARPFTEYLNKNGHYYGFDILEKDIKWCQKQYSKYQNFKFDFYSIKNDLYLPNAKSEASKFDFPFEASKFDLVMLISVFTHMQESTIENYFKQIVRVLKSGGKIYASFFLSQKNRTYVLFPFQNDTYCLHNKKVTNANVAYRRDYVYDLAKNSGLEIIQEKSGWWSKGYDDSRFDFQDIIVFKKL